ncbi:P-loop containing nucleoside triphosphate hydrolase protein [Phyllosticta capitalensis]
MQLCISHMQVLLDFIDTDLADTILLRQQIEKATIETISFENLWHLFPPSTLVFSQEQKMRDTDELSYPRAFRVFGVSGGRMNLGSRPPPGSMPGVKRPRRDEPPRRLVDNFRLDLHYVDFDGAHIGAETFRPLSVIRPFDGEKRILDLDFYPAQFDPEYFDKRLAMIARGRQFVQFLSESHQMYKGFSTGADPEEVHGEVVVDARTGYRMGKETTLLKDLEIGRLMLSSTVSDDTFEWTNCFSEGCLGCTNNFSDSSYEIRRFEHYVSGHDRAKTLWIPNERDQIDEEHLLLLPRDVLSFVFRSRSWKYLNVEHMTSIHEVHAHRDSGLDQLVMNDEHKAMVLALVESHSSGVRSTSAHKENETSMDLVKGKGKGLVILLHGAPGVGKTLTAETIAAYTRRPLYPITCGDIGETAIEVERKLEHHFKLAHLWGCVLLLDEADVFLAQRENSDVKRNALVSVFLRTLEYYSGILFLTTNRLGAIDEAFHSRIKIAIFYPRLDEKSTVKIWQTCLNRIEKMNADPDADIQIEFDNLKILEYAKKHYLKLKSRDEQSTWNGRQIRNAFQTAVALAKYDRQHEIQKAGLSQKEAMKRKKYRTAKLKRIHFQRVSDVMQDYDQYVEIMHDSRGPDDWAAMHDLRARPWSIGEDPPYSPSTRFSRGYSFESNPSTRKRPSIGSKRSSTTGVARKAKVPSPAPESDLASDLNDSSSEEESDEE